MSASTFITSLNKSLGMGTTPLVSYPLLDFGHVKTTQHAFSRVTWCLTRTRGGSSASDMCSDCHKLAGITTRKWWFDAQTTSLGNISVRVSGHPFYLQAYIRNCEVGIIELFPSKDLPSNRSCTNLVAKKKVLSTFANQAIFRSLLTKGGPNQKYSEKRWGTDRWKITRSSDIRRSLDDRRSVTNRVASSNDINIFSNILIPNHL